MNYKTTPTGINSTRFIIPKISSMQLVPKTKSVKLIKPKTLAYTSVITSTTDSTQYLTSVPLDFSSIKSGFFNIQPQAVTHESPSIKVSITDSDDEKNKTSVFDKDGHFIWDHKAIMLFFTEYKQHEQKLQKRKYQSKEAMFRALAESFRKKGYVDATKNHMKNKYKLLKKKWDKYIQRKIQYTMGKKNTGKGIKSISYENEMISLFGKSLDEVPSSVACRKKILQIVSQTSPENENEEQSFIEVHSPVSTISNKSQSNDDKSSMTDSNCLSLINTISKGQDSKLALALQSVKESICTVQQKDSGDKEITCTKMVIELQKCNEYLNVMSELQKERNIILQNQLQVLERIEKKMYDPTQIESDEEF